jgi:hypothetical protein
MKTLLGAVIAFALCTDASFGIVGYINLTLYPGDNLIANQFTNSGNTINQVLTSGVADGSTLTKWDPVANTFLPLAFYDASVNQWSINYTLTLGDGALLHSPILATNTFVGTVGNYPPVGSSIWHPNYPNGLYLISDPEPVAIPVDQQFGYTVGRAPVNGEWVRILDPSTQTYITSTFHSLTGTWDNGDPVIGVGEAAWYNLGPVAAPEPSGGALAALGSTLFLLMARQKRRSV